MRHKISGRRLKRDGGSRKALLKGLVTSVIEHERVVTTVPKARNINASQSRSEACDQMVATAAMAAATVIRAMRWGLAIGPR